MLRRSSSVILENKTQHLKLGIVSPNLYCDLAVVDPTLTISCPPHVTAASGMDALTHAIEIYTNRFSVPLVDTIALEAIRLAGRHLRTCVRDGSDVVAREGMALASLYAGLGLGPVNTAAVHALAYPLGAMFDVPHGLANSILLPYVMAYNRSACEVKYAMISEVLEISGAKARRDAASAAVEWVAALSMEIGIPQRLRDIKIPLDATSAMAGAAMKVERLLRNNPREITLEDAESIYERAY